jgi:hypothetical protein
MDYIFFIWREPSTGHGTRGIYILCVDATRVRACLAPVCVHSLIFEWIMSTFAGNILRLIINGKDYVLSFSRTDVRFLTFPGCVP